MEHVIFSFIMGHLEQYNLLNPNQHGFRFNHSCQTQHILLVEDILKVMDSHHQVDLILLDFTKFGKILVLNQNMTVSVYKMI